ncbi:hypothetical protein QJU89_04490 [Pasteurella skyensis]|nr:hypothetical protein [Pasteurella skyensis]MDP8162537.1 hypothetical protein [Pasteurella skyensis]MDP8172502.1 hypothetical protein [Pasteurella skyensis]MDP8177527.1 hypothetical protein [Pasteurella skyensis]MDP8178757.1 hypothetical protein [Pasteurella skyensis]MDP8182953.1 hypothetical protein [Pasteurella skyensis]
MDKYDSLTDCYCYPDSQVLKNKLNIKKLSELEEAEREITAYTIKNVEFGFPPYNLEYMCHLHY